MPDYSESSCVRRIDPGIQSYYYKHPSGDMIPVPDMEVMVNRKSETAEALTYQDTYGYQEVYSEDGSCNKSLQHSLNESLLMWLNNLYEQGHKIE